ncbi:MAG: DUF2281 domain-containing protein [Thermus sp.]|uniref:DUF2281 domain-containing protein n=1 Tax=Thermus TaxID=270 RepID=UPI001FAB0452|nr:DUF2281 domain-containing protein [Thermus thalpophilus]
MAVKEEVLLLLERMPESLQKEVADFARFLLEKKLGEELSWQTLSLIQAVRDLPEEDYTEADLKERW